MLRKIWIVALAFCTVMALFGITPVSAQSAGDQVPTTFAEQTARPARLYGVLRGKGIVEINPTSGAILKSFPMPTNPEYEEGLAFDGNTLYYINGQGLNKVITFDANLTKQQGTLPARFPPRIDAIAVNGDRLYALDWLQNQIVTVDLKTSMILSKIRLSFTGIGGISYGGDRNSLFVSSFDLAGFKKSKLYEINAETGAVINSFKTTFAAFGIAYSKKHGVVFVSADLPAYRKTEAIDPDTGKVVYSFEGKYSELAADSWADLSLGSK